MHDKQAQFCELSMDPFKQKIIASSAVDERINEWEHSWKPLPRDISYRLNNFSDDFSKKWQIRAVTVAFRAWQWRLSKLKFRRERNPDAHVDININWEDLAHFDNKKGVLMHAYYPGQGDISGDVHVNDNWDYVAGSSFQSMAHPPFVPPMIHELGHSIGLVHDPFDVTDIMYPSFDLGKKKWKIGNRSVQRVQARYGARSIPQRIIDRFALRRLTGRDFR
jgi:hypothetical protein